MLVDQRLLRRVDKRLRRGWSWERIAQAEGVRLSSLYTVIRRAGYTTGKRLISAQTGEPLTQG